MKFARSNGKYKQILLLIAYLCVPLLLYLPYICNGKLILYGDGLGFYRIKEVLKLAILDGEFPLWNKYLSNGVPYAADFTGVFYPFSWFVLFMPMFLFIYFFYAIHVAIGSLFMKKYLTEVGVSETIAIVTGFIYAFSIHLNGARKGHIMIIIVIVYLPVALYYMQKFLNTDKTYYLFGSSFALALAFFAGFPQDQLYIDAVAFLYFVIWCVVRKVKLKYALKNIGLWIGAFIGFIQIQLIPTIELMFEYSRNGAVGTSFEEFRKYSIHPFKAIMMVFPKIFGEDIFQAGGAYVSSEMDIEIYLGFAVCIVLISGVIYCRRNYYVMCSFGICAATFLFACVGNIPLLGEVVHKIPLVGSFHCCGRILFAFVFFAFVAFACILDEMLKTNGLKQLIQVDKKITKGMYAILFLGIVFVLMVTEGADYFAVMNKVWIIIQKPCLISLGCMILFICADKYIEKHKMAQKAINTIVVLVLGIVVIVDVYPYTSITNDVSRESIFNEWEEEYYQLIADEDMKTKAIVANSNINGVYETLLSVEKGIHYGIPTLNSYISLNNPKLYMLLSPNGKIGAKQNASGLYSGFEDINRNILENNDILSMISIKYIVDPQKNVPDDGMAIINKDEMELVFTTKNVCVDNLEGNPSVTQWEINLDANSDYSLYMMIDNLLQEDTAVDLDFYAVENYDAEEQQRAMVLNPGINTLSFHIFSGAVPADGQPYLRFLTMEDCSFEIRNLYLYKGTAEYEQAYRLLVDDGVERIFENMNVKDIIFAPQRVTGVSGFEDIYRNQRKYEFDNVSYVIGGETFDNAVDQIDDIVWGNNRVSVRVKCSGKGFINFSNNFYPGWKAYVDGKKTQIVEVNGLIQGIFLEEGEHFMEIVYRPYSVWAGTFITCLTIIMSIYMTCREKKKLRMPLKA